MPRCFTLAIAFVTLAQCARADDAITPETVEAVKKATVFIRVEGEDWSASGSGLVVAGADTTVLIATNDHVATAKPPTGKATLTVVFDSGAKTERSYTAELVTTDTERDLAILRVTGVKDPPRPIVYNDPPKLVETLQVYTFGFPLGKALSTSKGSPAVTVGKATVSSLRNGPDGELQYVQIDGSLNPGNSGGPVVDVKGRLVGVAVATIRDTQGIGLAVPSNELARLMQGRFGRIRVTPRKGGDGTVTVRVEADLLDPTKNLRGATAHYFLVAPKAKKPDTDALDRQPGSKKLELKIDKGVAVAEFTVAAAEGSVLVQLAAEAVAGKTAVTSRVRTFSLAPPPKASDLTGTPLPGWKEYSPRDGTFVVWVPEKPEKQTDEQRDGTIEGQRMRVNNVTGKTADGLGYEAESLLLPLAFAKVPRKDVYDMFRGALVKELGGKVTDSKDATSGALSGAEYVIESGSTVTRVRMYAVSARVYIVRVSGTADQVTSTEAEIVLSSYRLPGAAKGPNEPKGGTDTAVSPKGKDPVILGHPTDPAFKDLAPEGGYLIGLEIGVGKFRDYDVVQAVRPIYLTGAKESMGDQRGPKLERVVVVKAKPGYAVGAMTVKAGLGLDGMSVTFMKITDGKLDPKDAYESEWVGGKMGRPPVKLGGDGSPVVGVIGRTSPNAANGFGLLLKGQETFDPAKKK
jgi:S1-C subfamily serine protease